MTKKIFTILSITFGLLLAKTALAGAVTLIPTEKQVGLHEQFYLDLMLDPEGVSVNGIEGNIIFPNDHFSFVRVEEAKSMVNLWIEKPILVNNTIKFAGIIPNGFDGVIDPFNQYEKLPGPILRFIFEPIKPGQAMIVASELYISLNDGMGTTKEVPMVRTNIVISDKENKVMYENKSDVPPELEASVVESPDLFDNKFVLIFKAVDKNSGIKEVLVKEGNGEWKPITSPYLLEDQSRHSIIVLQAINYSGVNTVVKIDPLPYKLSLIDYVLLIVFVVVLFLAFRRRYANKKKK